MTPNGADFSFLFFLSCSRYTQQFVVIVVEQF